MEESPGRALDVCAAPGGKTTLVAGSAPFVVGADLTPSRVDLLAGNVRRLGLDNVGVVVADGLAPPFQPSSFAGVLVRRAVHGPRSAPSAARRPLAGPSRGRRAPERAATAPAYGGRPLGGPREAFWFTASAR